MLIYIDIFANVVRFHDFFIFLFFQNIVEAKLNERRQRRERRMASKRQSSQNGAQIAAQLPSAPPASAPMPQPQPVQQVHVPAHIYYNRYVCLYWDKLQSNLQFTSQNSKYSMYLQNHSFSKCILQNIICKN